MFNFTVVTLKLYVALCPRLSTCTSKKNGTEQWCWNPGAVLGQNSPPFPERENSLPRSGRLDGTMQGEWSVLGREIYTSAIRGRYASPAV